MNIYELDKQYSALMGKILENEGELNQEIEDALAITESNIAFGLSRYSHFVDKINNDSELLRKKAKEYADAAKRLELLNDKLDDRLKQFVSRFPNREAFSDSEKFKVSDSKGSVEILSEKDIPDAYKKTVVTTVPDKTKILEDLKMGLEVSGCSLKPGLMLRRYKHVR